MISSISYMAEDDSVCQMKWLTVAVQAVFEPILDDRLKEKILKP